ncbi:MAG TPA: MscL family protein [Mycobacteriales bacterium]|jgi:large conductance mechanosensitive channel|nr:MscL family protein [Mycobacteriales bacterium]
MSDADGTDKFEQFLTRSRETLRLSGFRKFILRGNVVDLAIGVVIGAAFTAVINSLVKDFLTPLIGAAVGAKCTTPKTGAGVVCNTFADRFFSVRGSRFFWGDFVNSILTLALVGLALYYFVVIPVNSLMERFKPETEPGKQTKVCPECKSSIPFDATRCAFCTVEQPPLVEADLKTGETA